MEDKKNRLDQLLIQGGAEDDEAIEDTCLDLANYAIMLAMYYIGKKPLRGFEPQSPDA